MTYLCEKSDHAKGRLEFADYVIVYDCLGNLVHEEIRRTYVCSTCAPAAVKYIDDYDKIIDFHRLSTSERTLSAPTLTGTSTIS
jgi:hypothetical protein